MQITEELIQFAMKAGAAVLEIMAGFYLGPKIKHLILNLSTKKIDAGVLTFLSSLANIGIKALAIIIALSQLGIDMNVMVGLFSAVGLGVSLALQNNMANLASGIQILLTKPFVVGDLISVDGNDGNVQKIELMFTTLVTFNKQEVVIPNSVLVNNSLINYTQEQNRRVVITVELPTDYNPAEFKEEILALANNHPSVLKDPAASVVTSALNFKYVEVTLFAYTLLADYYPTFTDLNQQVLEKKLEMNIPQPYTRIKMEDEEGTEKSSKLAG